MVEAKTPNKFCENCGELLNPGASFCEACGHPAADSSELRPASQPVPLREERAGRPKFKGIIAGLVIVLLAVAGLLMWRQFGMQPTVGTGINSAGQKTNPETNQGSGKTPLPDLTNPQTYLPKPDQKYYYYQYYADGDEGEVALVAAKVASGTLVSTVEFAQSKLYGGESIFTQHYLMQPNGVYVANDDTDYLAALWLKNSLAVGQEWTVPGITVNIKAIGSSCDLGFMKIDNCLVIERRYEAVADHVDTVYIAPGYGEVMIKTSPEGLIVKKLTRVTPLDEKTAADIVKNNSLHLDSFK